MDPKEEDVMPELNDDVPGTGVSMDQPAGLRPGFATFAWRVLSLHVLTYFLVGPGIGDSHLLSAGMPAAICLHGIERR